jgi:hypothetical protein
MLANINLVEQNRIEIPKEVQFYIKNENGFCQQQNSRPIIVTKELKELVEKSGLFREEDKAKFVLKS